MPENTQSSLTDDVSLDTLKVSVSLYCVNDEASKHLVYGLKLSDQQM